VLLQLTLLHGDIAGAIDPGLSEPALLDYDEFDVPLEGQAGQRASDGSCGPTRRTGIVSAVLRAALF
jgi:hypothetical protein